MLDDTDRRLLRLLQNDPTLKPPELAQAAGTTAARVSRRLDRMRAEGILGGSRVVIDWAALGYTVGVSLRVTLDKTQPRAFDEFLAAARDVREVTEIQTFLGRVDVRLFVVARDLPDYQRVYRTRILNLPHIADIAALMDVAGLKSGSTVPL